ncbi:MAG: tRNA pseudouridine(38-40) synthase TruA [Lachnospiraceae bacterium]|nr:tRNA pseudouridine(38-40) synthase TruA [Lachnospiraceae bacterium]
METKRILLEVAYDGTAYHGWQAQDGVSTIEGEINKALKRLTGEDIEVIGASRTDTGVHGLCNLAVFDSNMNILPEKYAFALNSFLPGDIVVRRSVQVSDCFHPRKCKTKKTYRYSIDNEVMPDPLKIRYSWHVSYDMDIDRMSQGAKYLLGEHDFSSFCASGSTALSHVRTVDDIQIVKNGSEIAIYVTGNGFLYNMVRIIVGTLAEVGRGKIEPHKVDDILKACDRTMAGPTAPACGLTLLNIQWEDS